MAPPPMPHYPFPNVTTPSPAPESRSHSVLDSPGGWEGDISVKEEDEDMDGETYQQGGSPDPLSMPMTPGEAGEHDTPLAKGRVGVRWARTKKPMKEVMGKIMIELRRRDEVCHYYLLARHDHISSNKRLTSTSTHYLVNLSILKISLPTYP